MASSPQANAVDETSKGNVIGKFATIEEFTKESFADIVKATKAVNAFPQGTARDLYCSYPSYGRVIDQQSHRILGLISKVLKSQNVSGNIQRRQPDEQFEMLLECNDAIFERLGSNLDDLAGIKKIPAPVIVEERLSSIPKSLTVGTGAGSWNAKRNLDANTNSILSSARLITAKNIARPQISFAVPVDNSSLTPFVPRLKEKPNSLKPLAILPEYDDSGAVASYLHPYEFELVKFTVPPHQLKPVSPQKPKDISITELAYIDSVPEMRKAVEELRTHKIIAVDVEHHSYRTFLGLTCLVQISSTEKDYIFDALKLREYMHELNLIFTDPCVVKIFHGADSDIEWLQRDLSIYVVNMFDTHQAAKSLNFARLSLSYLLKHYCDLELDKSLQLADWRMRPLPHDLLEYARRDTHYLVYVYQCLTNDLLEAGNQNPTILGLVYQRSTELCKKRYQKPIVTSTTHMELCRKAKRIFDNRQLYALEHILQWRDRIARSEDESYGYVLPNHMMLQISESLPREMQGILACCNPIPPLVRQHLHTLHQIILHARQQPLVKPILETMDYFRDAAMHRKVYNEKLHCILDNTHEEEFRDDLPVLLRFENNKMVVNKDSIKRVNSCSAQITFFEKCVMREFVKPDLSKLLMPYQRFLAYLPFAEQEKRKEAERLEALNKARRLCPAAPEMMHITQEKGSERTAEVQNGNNDDDIYKMPVREMIKRKHKESIAKKAARGDNQYQQNAKRFKVDNIISKKDQQKSAESSTTNQTCVDLTGDNGEEDEAPVELPICVEDTADNSSLPKKSKYQSRNKNRFKRSKTNKASNYTVDPNTSTTSQGTGIKNFDYKNVNFKKFSGGAKRAQGTEIKAKHQGKNNPNKANNKKFNKLFTFSNVKGSKK